MRAAGYIRVSTEEQQKHGWNLGADRQRIDATIAERGWTPHVIYDDGGRQGDDPDRPAFLQMLSEVDRFDVLIIRDLDRFSRTLAIYAAAVDDLIEAGVTLYEFASDGIGLRLLDLTDEDDRALADIKAVFAQMEKAKIKRRVRQAKGARAKAGGHPGGKRPYGYRYADGGPLEVDPTEAAVMVRMFEMAQATSQRKIARFLNDEGISSSAGTRWCQASVAQTLHNPLYIGKIRRRVAGEWEMYDGQHEAIVDDALWHWVNRLRATPARRAGGRPKRSKHLLTRGLLRCGSCGSAMIPIASYRGRAETYNCMGRRDHGPGFCRQPSVRRELIDEAVQRELHNRCYDVRGAQERAEEQREAALPLAQAAVQEAERELLEVNADARIAKIKRGWQEDVLSDDEYRTQRAEVEDELAAARAAVEQAQHHLVQIADAAEGWLEQIDKVRVWVWAITDQALDMEDQRAAIRQLFASFELCGPQNPFGLGGGDGMLLPGHEDLKAGEYRIWPRYRPEMVDLDRLEPIKIPLPGTKPTYSTCR